MLETTRWVRPTGGIDENYELLFRCEAIEGAAVLLVGLPGIRFMGLGIAGSSPVMTKLNVNKQPNLKKTVFCNNYSADIVLLFYISFILKV